MTKFDTQELCGAKTDRGYNMTTASGKPFYPADPRQEDVRIEDIAAHLSRICRFNGALKRDIIVSWCDPITDNMPWRWYCHEQNLVYIDFEIYSVAQHSVLVCSHVDATYNGAATADEIRQLKLAALLHDAAEAYVGDMPKPIKSLHPGRKKVERAISAVIEARFGLPSGILDHPLIKEQDYRAVLTEHRDLQENDGTDWGLDTAKAEPWPERIVPLLPRVARALFMKWFNELYKGE